MKHENVHNFFHSVSRVIIVLPIIIIILALIFKPEAPKSASQVPVAQNNIITSPTISLKIPMTPVPTVHKTVIDINGPVVCTFNQPSGYSGTLYIKNKMIYADAKDTQLKKTISAIFKEDCAYKWEKGTLIGSKLCGLNKYMSVLEMLSNVGVLNVESIIEIVADYTGQPYDSNMAQTTVIDCKKNSISDTTFVVPTTIQFQLKSSVSPGVSK